MRIKIVNGERLFAVDIDPRRDEFYTDLHEWLNKNIKGYWTTTVGFVGFKEESDAMFFILGWQDVR